MYEAEHPLNAMPAQAMAHVWMTVFSCLVKGGPRPNPSLPATACHAAARKGEEARGDVERRDDPDGEVEAVDDHAEQRAQRRRYGDAADGDLLPPRGRGRAGGGAW